MKTFLEWLELREDGFFSNLFGKNKKPIQTTLAPAPPVTAPEKGNLEAIRRIFDGPNYDPARYAPKQDQDKQAQEARPAPKSEIQPQLSSSPQNPEEYLEEVANKYWGVGKEQPPFFASWPGEFHERWSEYKQKNDAFSLHELYYVVALKESSGQVVEAVKNAMVEILEKKFRWVSFPKTDTVELGRGRNQLDWDKAIFVDGRKTTGGTVKVLARGFEDRKGKMIFEPGVVRMG